MKGAVDVWTINLDVRRRTVLSEGEAARANRFHSESDRMHWSNARSSLRCVLAWYLSTVPESVAIIFGPHGKPALESGPHFNISHSHGWAMIAVSRDAPVGIDIERVRGNVDIAKLLHRIGETNVSGSPAELFQLWTRREAKTKALGTPLMQLPVGDLRVVNLTAPDGFVAALAHLGNDPGVTYRNGNELKVTEY